MCWQLIIGLFTDIVCPLSVVPAVVVHAIAILFGYICFVKALQYIPLALAGLLEIGSLFLTFLIDTILGYISRSVHFILLLILFIFPVFLFTDNCREEVKNCSKNLKTISFVLIFISIVLYLSAPYLVKISDNAGANEIAINLEYYFVAVPYFMYRCLKLHTATVSVSKQIKWWQNFYFLCFIIGIMEALYYVFKTISFMNDTPTVVILIMQMRVFILFLLSVIFRTDRFTFKKFIALVLGCIASIGVYLS